MNHENEKLLIVGLEELGIEVNPLLISNLKSFISLFNTWNQKMNLSSIRNEREIVIKHILDSLSLIPIIRELKLEILSEKWIDLGSGGGFPGIPLKIALPHLKIDLAEVNKKKICFLKEVLLNLPHKDIEIIDSSIGRVTANYSVLITRAFGSIAKIIQESKKYLSSGYIFCYKGKLEKIKLELSELSEKQRDHIQIYPANPPFLDEERHLVQVLINFAVASRGEQRDNY